MATDSCGYHVPVIGYLSFSNFDAATTFCVSSPIYSFCFLCKENGFADACVEICSDDGCFFVHEIYCSFDCGDDRVTFSYRDVKSRVARTSLLIFSHLFSSDRHRRCRKHCCWCCRDPPA